MKIKLKTHTIAALIAAMLAPLACDVEDTELPTDDDEFRLKVGGTICKLKEVTFAGDCLTPDNADQTIDVAAEDADLLDVRKCRATSGAQIQGCAEVLVDLGTPGHDQVVYRLVDNACTSSPFTTTCFGGFEVVNRIVYESTALIEGDTRILDVLATFQYPDSKPAGLPNWGGYTPMIATWSDDFSVEGTSFVDGVSQSSGLSLVNSVAVYDDDGELLFADTEEIGNLIAESGDDGCGDDIGCKCARLAKSGANIAGGTTEMLGSGSCGLMPDKAKVGFKGGGPSGTGPVSTELAWDIDSCDRSQRGFDRVLEGFAGLFTEVCESHPDWFWPGLYDEFDGIPSDLPAEVEAWAPADMDSNCENLGFSTMEYVEFTRDGEACSGIAPVNYECGDDGLGNCECVGEPDLSYVEEEACAIG